MYISALMFTCLSDEHITEKVIKSIFLISSKELGIYTYFVLLKYSLTAEIILYVDGENTLFLRQHAEHVPIDIVWHTKECCHTCHQVSNWMPKKKENFPYSSTKQHSKMNVKTEKEGKQNLLKNHNKHSILFKMLSELPLNLQLKKPMVTRNWFETALSSFPLLFLNQTKKKKNKPSNRWHNQMTFSSPGKDCIYNVLCSDTYSNK